MVGSRMSIAPVLGGCLDMAVSTSDTPMVSVVIPTYNRKNVVRNAIESVLKQSFSDYELIVIDDGSADGTGDMIKSAYPSVKYVFQENAGASAARNQGIRTGSGEYVAFLDADDTWFETKLEEQVAAMAGNSNAAICITDWQTMKGGRTLYESTLHECGYEVVNGNLTYDYIVTRFCLLPSCSMLKRDTLMQLGLFDENLTHVEDWDLMTRALLVGELVVVDKPLMERTISDDSLVNDWTKLYGAALRGVDKHISLLAAGELPVPDKASARRALHAVHRKASAELAYQLYVAGETLAAQKVLLRSLGVTRQFDAKLLKLLAKTIVPYRFGRTLKKAVSS